MCYVAPVAGTMAMPMTLYPDDSTIDDLLHQLSESFLLDKPIAGDRLGDLLAVVRYPTSVRPATGARSSATSRSH